LNKLIKKTNSIWTGFFYKNNCSLFK
jgi:hypothetical protein